MRGRVVRSTPVSSPRIVSPLATWWSDASLARFSTRTLGRRLALLRARDRQWRSLAPPFDRLVELIGAGVPHQVALERRHERAPDPARARAALAAGATVFFPQAHQVLPRVARLMVALRAGLLGGGRAECSFLFLVEGRGREGMGLHHVGGVDAFWLQLEGHRTVTLGPPVARGVPEELDDDVAPGRRGWQTLTLPPGSLLYLPPRTPHRVVCHERSLALTLTWGGARRARHAARAMHSEARDADQRARVLTAWDVASGHVEPWPAERTRSVMWTQVPIALGRANGRRGDVAIWVAGDQAVVAATSRSLVKRLAAMPAVRGARAAADVAALRALGILGDEDLPLLVRPDAPAELDGWRFA